MVRDFRLCGTCGWAVTRLNAVYVCVHVYVGAVYPLLVAFRVDGTPSAPPKPDAPIFKGITKSGSVFIDWCAPLHPSSPSCSPSCADTAPSPL